MIVQKYQRTRKNFLKFSEEKKENEINPFLYNKKKIIIMTKI